VDENTWAFFCKSVSNLPLHIFDIEAIAGKAAAIGVPLIVDSTFSTHYYLCKPFDFGADIIATSATKWLRGRGTCLRVMSQ
jgi:O-acetylhomoserine (thiol)-lyase